MYLLCLGIWLLGSWFCIQRQNPTATECKGEIYTNREERHQRFGSFGRGDAAKLCPDVLFWTL